MNYTCRNNSSIKLTIIINIRKPATKTTLNVKPVPVKETQRPRARQCSCARTTHILSGRDRANESAVRQRRDYGNEPQSKQEWWPSKHRDCTLATPADRGQLNTVTVPHDDEAVENKWSGTNCHTPRSCRPDESLANAANTGRREWPKTPSAVSRTSLNATPSCNGSLDSNFSNFSTIPMKGSYCRCNLVDTESSLKRVCPCKYMSFITDEERTLDVSVRDVIDFWERCTANAAAIPSRGYR